VSRWRYLKFGVVGASGTLVNLLVLYLAQEFFLASIEPATQRLYASLACAIGLATVNILSGTDAGPGRTANRSGAGRWPVNLRVTRWPHGWVPACNTS